MKKIMLTVFVVGIVITGSTQIIGVSDYVREVPSLEEELGKGLIAIDTVDSKNLDTYWYLEKPTLSGIQSVMNEAKRILGLNYLTFSEPEEDDSELSEKVNYSFVDQIFNQIENGGEVVILYYYIPDYRPKSDLIWCLQFYVSETAASVYIFQL
jgi:hypothetical protein